MNNEVIGTCIDYTHDGKGVIKIDKFPIFVDNLLIGEEAKILITKRLDKYYYGRVIELIKTSKERVKPICPNYKICGGCNIQHMSYEEQLRFKQKRVQDVIKHISNIDVPLPKITGMDNPYRYRNKVQVPIGITYNGFIVAGFYHPKSHSIIDMEECFIEDKDADNVINVLKKLIKKFNIEPCDMHSNTGVIRYAIVRKSYSNNDMLLVLVTRTNYLPHDKLFIKELIEKCPNLLSKEDLYRRFPKVKI